MFISTFPCASTQEQDFVPTNGLQGSTSVRNICSVSKTGRGPRIRALQGDSGNLGRIWPLGGVQPRADTYVCRCLLALLLMVLDAENGRRVPISRVQMCEGPRLWTLVVRDIEGVYSRPRLVSM